MQLPQAWNRSSYSRSALIALVALAVPAFVRAQSGTITGRIIASSSTQPLSDVRVTVVGSALSTLSGADGRYTLRGVPNGNSEVRVLRVGYQERRSRRPLARAGR